MRLERLTRRWPRGWTAAGLLFFALACSRGNPLLSPRPDRLARVGPDSFDVRLETSRGPVSLRIRRDWSPLGADRFHYLVKNGFYDEARFFRVVDGFVAQWGLPANPALADPWQARTLSDEPVKSSNTRGRISYARGGPNTRSIQLYINLRDNVRLDSLNGFGFPPIGEVIEGMTAVDSLTSEYGGTRENRLEGPSQDSIRVAGNGYLVRRFPKLDYIKATRITREWRGR